VATVAFQGVEAVPVDVQVHIASGFVGFTVVGLGDKAVAESRERVRAALTAVGLALPAKRITVNLAPADLPKEGSHYDLPIALGLLAAMGVLPSDALSRYAVVGELSLDGSITGVAGALPAAIAANAQGLGLICPKACGPEAAWAGEDVDVLAAHNLLQIVNHFGGSQVLSRPRARRCRRCRAAARPQRHQGPGGGQAGARGGRGRRPSPAVRRPAGCRQVDAGEPPAVDPAADGRPGDARRQHDRVGRRPAFGRQAVAPPAVPLPPPFRQHGRARRRRACAPSRARWRWPTTACCSSTNCPSSSPGRSRPCASRSNPARRWWRAPITTSPIPPASSSSPP
jgi:hypothetical protein